MTQQLEFGETPKEVLRLRDGHNKTWMVWDECCKMEDNDPQKQKLYNSWLNKLIPRLFEIEEMCVEKGWTSCIWPEGTVLSHPCLACPRDLAGWLVRDCPGYNAALTKGEMDANTG